MNIWNNVFLALVFLFAGLAVFFTSQEMKIRQQGEQRIAAFEKKIVDSENLAKSIVEGTSPGKPATEKAVDEMALGEVVLKLQDLVFERGKAWFGCQPGNINVEGSILAPQQLGGNNPTTPDDRLKPIQLVEVKLTITGPVLEKDGKEEVVPPEDLKGLVYLFDEGQEGVGGSFLGRFTVVAAPQKVQNGYQVTLNAANELTETEIQRIQKAGRSTWAIYTIMPKDRHRELISRLTPDEIDTLIPAAKRAELTNPDRPLRDFDELLTWLYQWRVVLQQDIDQSKRDIESLDASLLIATNEEKNLQNDIDFEKKRIEAMKNQVEALTKIGDDYDARIEDLKQKIDATQKQNEWYVAKIAEYQLKVAELIEQRAEAAAKE